MPEYATITVQVTEHGDDLVGVDAELLAYPLTEGRMLTYPNEPERLSVGTWKASTILTSDGSIALQIPTDTFQNPVWRFDLRLTGGKEPINIPLGTYQITESAKLSQLVNIDVTSVSPDLVASVAQYAADAQAAAETVAAIPTTTDGLIASRVNDPTSATSAALSGTIAAPINTTRARSRALTVRTRPRLVGRATIPSALSLGFTVPVFYDGAKFTTPFDPMALAPTPSGQRYVDIVNGAAGTVAGTQGAPHQTMLAAMQQAAEGTEIVVVTKGLIPRNRGVQANVMAKSLRLTAAYPGETIVSTHDDLTWTAHPTLPKVWQATRSNVFRVVDIAVDKLGFIYTKATTEAEVAATPGSWYANGSTLNVQTVDGVIPTNNRILALLVTGNFIFDGTSRTADMSIGLDGLTVFGGTTGFQLANPGTFEADFYGRNYVLAHSGGNGLGVNGFRRVLSRNGKVVASELDGFNYHYSSSKPAPKFVEIDCEAHSTVSTTSPTMNATTAHDGAHGLRIGGAYHDTYGTPVADVHEGTKTVNLSCDAWGSTAPSGDYNAAFSAQQAGAEMWVNGCRAWGTQADLYAVAGATVHADRTEFDTAGGPGVLNITNAR